MRDYGSLRRHTGDGSWQWLLMGIFLGGGFALVLCVGGYALGAITFPILEGGSATPIVQVVPNPTEVAQQALAAAQTLTAAQQIVGGAQPTAAPPATAAAVLPTPTPSPLPTSAANGAGTSGTAPPAVLNPTATVLSPPQTAALAQNTAVVGTPPAAEPTVIIEFPQAPTIPAELDAIKTEMVLVPGGTFLMGTTWEEGKQAMDACASYNKSCTDLAWISDSIPTHQVTVDSFQMDIYEVSVAQYVAFLNWLGPNQHKTGCDGNPCVKTTLEEPNSYIEFDGTTYSVRNPTFYPDHPVTFVTWWGAQAYCRTLNRRLPTEAEWEHAARGPQNFIYPWGFEFDQNRAMSSISPNAGTVPVDSYPNGTSPYGIFNMAGNVSEWVFDWYQVDYYTQQATNPEPNPKGPPTGVEKVIRGGSWDTIPLFLRAVHRMSARPDMPTAAIGFRCVADTVSPAPQTAPAATSGAPSAPSGGAPTMAPPPTQPPPVGPTATIAPG